MNNLKNEGVSACAVFLAGGSGRRMAGSVDDKILAPLKGVPAVLHSVLSFDESKVAEIFVFVCRDEIQLGAIRALVSDATLSCGKKIFFCLGGGERRDSVLSGLRCAVQNGVAANGLVFIHDCARPLISAHALHKLRDTALREGSAVLAHRCVNTIKRVPAGTLPGKACVIEDLERARLWEMETPQVFPLGKILLAYEKIVAENLPTTDDVSAFPEPVALVENTEPNPKLTVPADFIILETLLSI